MAIVFGPLFEVQANDLSKVRNLKAWLLDNEVFVEAQFQVLELPVEANFDSEVAHYIEGYLRRGRHGTERMLGKAVYYFPIFEAELAARRLPEALKYLPVVESALNPRIESPVGAGGLWQFMPATADFFDLKINRWVDERYDPERSSAAAAELLSFLFKQFDNWNLALAAYNCGPGRVKKAIRRAGVISYEAIKAQLPKQTQHYITKFKAAAYVMAYHDFFGLETRPDKRLPTDVEGLVLRETATFEEIAERAEVSIDIIEALNPAYLQEIVPASPKKTRRVLLPTSAISKWIASRKGAGASQNRKEKMQKEKENAVAVGVSSVENLPAATLPALATKNVLLTAKWPLPIDPHAGDAPRDSIVAWYQRNGISWKTSSSTEKDQPHNGTQNCNLKMNRTCEKTTISEAS